MPVRKDAGEEICVAADRGVEGSALQSVVQQQGQDVRAGIGGGPPGREEEVKFGCHACVSIQYPLPRTGTVPGKVHESAT